MRKSLLACTAGLMCSLGLATSAQAETLTYHYDALGRLIESFSDKSSLRTDYSLDPADNRTFVFAHNTIVVLQADQSIYSPDQRFRLVMQTDGNLVLYGPSGALWSSATAPSGGKFAQMQADGNLVVYSSSNTALWASATGGNAGAWLALQNDGNLVIYDGANTAIWNTGTGGH